MIWEYIRFSIIGMKKLVIIEFYLFELPVQYLITAELTEKIINK